MNLRCEYCLSHQAKGFKCKSRLCQKSLHPVIQGLAQIMPHSPFFYYKISYCTIIRCSSVTTISHSSILYDILGEMFKFLSISFKTSLYPTARTQAGLISAGPWISGTHCLFGRHLKHLPCRPLEAGSGSFSPGALPTRCGSESWGDCAQTHIRWGHLNLGREKAAKFPNVTGS